MRMCHDIKDELDDSAKRKMLYHGYANRSLVLFRSNQYEPCLEDTEAALHYSLDSGKKEYLIHDRRARCYLFRRKWAQSRQAFQDALDSVDAVDDLKEEVKEAFKAQVVANKNKILPDEVVDEVNKSGALEDEDFVMEASDFFINLEKSHPDHKGLTSKIKVFFLGH